MSELIRKMKSELDKGVVTASVTSSTMLEVSKLNTVISGLKTSRSTFIQQLGELVYEIERQFRPDDSDAKRVLVDKIIDIDQKIIERGEQIEKLKHEKNEILSGIGRSTVPAPNSMNSTQASTANQIRCTVCGAGLKANAKFCGGCGNSMVIAKPAPNEVIQENSDLRCGCGENLRFDAKFCSKCGTVVQVSTLAEDPMSVSESSPIHASESEPVLEIEQPCETTNEEKKEICTSDPTIVCNTCGNTLKNHVRFCGRCGASQVA